MLMERRIWTARFAFICILGCSSFLGAHGEAQCIQCDNYVDLSPNVDKSKPGYIDCGERVDRSVMNRTKRIHGHCPGMYYDGCFKLVTKSYKTMSSSTPVLIATIVTRDCVNIPGYGLGCHEIVGGAGTRRWYCFCKGDYCNSAPRSNTAFGGMWTVQFLFVFFVPFVWTNRYFGHLFWSTIV